MFDISKVFESMKGIASNVSPFQLFLLGLAGCATAVELHNQSQPGGEQTIDAIKTIEANNSCIEDNVGEIDA